MKRVSIKHYLVVCLLLLELTALLLAFKSYANKTIDEIENTDVVDSKTFAMYIENDAGEYDKLLDSTLFPTDTHELNYKLTTCVDNKGNSVDSSILAYSDGKVTATSNKTVFCYLYFEYLPKAYAIYSETDNSLRFYNNKDVEGLKETYNNLSVTNVYTEFINNSYTSASSIPWNNNASNIKNIVVEEEIKPADMSYWFSELRNAEKLNLLKVDTSSVASISYTFSYTGYNTNSFQMDVSNWNTSKVTNMQGTFYFTGYKATEWDIGDLSNWQTGNVTDFYRLFSRAGYSADAFNIGDISNWDTSKVTRMRSTFYETGNKATEWFIGDLSNWNTAKVTNMQTMFMDGAANANSINLNLSSWDTSSVTNMQGLFRGFGRLSREWYIGDLSNWNTTKVTDMMEMFCHVALEASAFDVGSLGNWDVSNVINMSRMFDHAGWKVLTFNIGDISKWDTSKVTNMSIMFDSAGQHATFALNLSTKEITREDGTTYIAWDVSKVTDYSDFNLGVESKITPPTWVN